MPLLYISYSKNCGQWMFGDERNRNWHVKACNMWLSIVINSVITVSVDLPVYFFSAFVVIQFSNLCKYVCCCLAAVSC